MKHSKENYHYFKIPTILCQDEHLQKLHRLCKITRSALGQSTAKFYGRTQTTFPANPGLLLTDTIFSNIIQNILFTNVPHFLKNVENLMTHIGFSRSLLNQLRRWKKVEYRQRKEASMNCTTLYSRILMMSSVPKFHLP